MGVEASNAFLPDFFVIGGERHIYSAIYGAEHRPLEAVDLTLRGVNKKEGGE